MRVEDLLHLSPLRLVTAGPETPAREAARRMAQYDVGILVVMDERDEIAGVLSERDLVTALGQPGTALDDTAVGELMTRSVITIDAGEALVEAVLAMNAHGIRHLIATRDGKPEGVVSIRDVLRVFARRLLHDAGEDDTQLTLDFARALAA